MLVVIAVIGILAGIGVGVLTGLQSRTAFQARVSAVRSIVRHARNAARSDGRGAWVVIRPDGIEAVSWQTLGRWHLEADDVTSLLEDDGGPPDDGGPVAEVRGAYHLDGTAHGPVSFLPGKIGQGLEAVLDGRLVVDHAPRLGPTLGIAAEMWVRPYDLSYFRRPDADLERQPPARPDGSEPEETDPYVFTLLRKGSAFRIRVGEDRSVRVLVGGRSGRREVVAEVRTPARILPEDRWARLRVAFDGDRIGVWVDGIERAVRPVGSPDSLELPERLHVEPDEPLVVGSPDPDLSWFGMVDEIEVQGVVAAARQEIPTSLAVRASETEIVFDGRGRLDPLVHAGPVEILCWPSTTETLRRTQEAREEAEETAREERGSTTASEDPPDVGPVFPPAPDDEENVRLERIRIQPSGTVD